MPEGEQPEDGSPEELDFMQNLMKNLNDQADPILATVIKNIIQTDQAQRELILNQLKEELKIEELQRLTKESSDNKEKIECWNKLKVEIIREFFYYIYTSQVFLSCSYIAFSILGKQLFEISSGVGNDNYMEDLIEKLGGEGKEQPQSDQQKKDDEEAKKKAEFKEKETRVVHNHFMHLLFDVLTDFIKYLKKEVIDPVVDDVLSDINLKSKFSVESFEFEVLNKIFTEINEQLFNATEDEEEAEGEDDTDFDDESLTSSHIKTTEEKLENLKENSVKKYKSFVILKLVNLFNDVDIQKYTKGIEKDLKELNNLKLNMDNS